MELPDLCEKKLRAPSFSTSAFCLVSSSHLTDYADYGRNSTGRKYAVVVTHALGCSCRSNQPTPHCLATAPIVVSCTSAFQGLG